MYCRMRRIGTEFYEVLSKPVFLYDVSDAIFYIQVSMARFFAKFVVMLEYVH